MTQALKPGATVSEIILRGGSSDLDGVCADEGGAPGSFQLSGDPAMGERVYATASRRVDPG